MMISVAIWLTLLACVFDSRPASGDSLRPQDQATSSVTLASQISLARLVDLCAERLQLNVEYDASMLRDTVSLRLGPSISNDELWLITNHVLAARGFTTVQVPETDLIHVVRISDAPGMADAIMPAAARVIGQSARHAGFMTAIFHVEHRSPDSIISAIKVILSKAGGQVARLGDSRLILISDLRPRVEEALRLINMLDVPEAPPQVRKLSAEYVNATQLASLVTAAVAARDAITTRPLRGKVTPVPDGSAIILICPPDESEAWMKLIERFDEREAVKSVTYAPQHFAVGEVSRLIEQTAHTPGPRGSGDQWRLVTDELTGTIIVTATPSEHGQIENLIERLDAAPAEARRPVRAFPIRNRNVREVVDILSQLVEAGVLEHTASEDTIDIETGGRSRARASRPAGSNEPTRIRTGQPTMDRSTGSTPDGTAQVSPGQGTAPLQSGGRSTQGLSLTADEGTNMLIATGDPRTLAQLEQLIQRLDRRQPQVMLEVLVISLSDSQTLDLGVELQKLEVSGSTLITLGSLFGLGTPGIAELADPPSPGRGFTGLVLNPGDFSVLLRALQTLNDGRSLSLPKVLVGNNQQATLDSVLQEPFTSLNALDTVATTSFGGTLDAGTVVTVTPQIAEADHLLLEYSVALSTFVGESSDPGLPPPRQQNRLQSQVTIPDGYTVVVGGLDVTSEAEALSQIPLLGDIPIIGEAFKNRSRTKNHSRFFVFIRANVLRHQSFEDLKYLSDRDRPTLQTAGVEDNWPTVEPRIIH